MVVDVEELELNFKVQQAIDPSGLIVRSRGHLSPLLQERVEGVLWSVYRAVCVRSRDQTQRQT